MPTPACNFCGCKDADVIHIAYHCPRFQFIRDEWSPITRMWPFWPACKQHCLVATGTRCHGHSSRTCQEELANRAARYCASLRPGSQLKDMLHWYSCLSPSLPGQIGVTWNGSRPIQLGLCANVVQHIEIIASSSHFEQVETAIFPRGHDMSYLDCCIPYIYAERRQMVLSYIGVPI